jgi:hypothetical protein
MNKLFRNFFIITVLVVLVAGLFVWKWVFKEQDKSVISKTADMVVQADVLVRDFEADENKANIKYLNKVLVVNGSIDSKTMNDKEITVVLKNKGDVAGVSCSFDQSTIGPSTFETGKAIRVKGVCTGFLLDVVLVRCALIK